MGNSPVHQTCIINYFLFKEETGSRDVHILSVDMSLLSSVRQATETLLDQYGVPDILINNAGELKPIE